MWFARLLFVTVFVLVILVIVGTAKLLIPDVPSSLKRQMRRETHLMVELEKKRVSTGNSASRRSRQATEKAASGHHYH